MSNASVAIHLLVPGGGWVGLKAVDRIPTATRKRLLHHIMLIWLCAMEKKIKKRWANKFSFVTKNKYNKMASFLNFF
jgi:hypothetical protein